MKLIIFFYKAVSLKNWKLVEKLSGGIFIAISLGWLSSHITFMSNYQFNNQDLTATIDRATDKLNQFLTDPDFDGSIDLVSENNWNSKSTRELITNIVNNDEFPAIEVVSASQLKAYGGFGNNTIYLSNALFAPGANPQIATGVLLEEVGHYIDSQLNPQDSPGDEGAIFSSLVQNQTFGSAELLELRTRDDSNLISLNGKTIAIEQSNPNYGAEAFPTSRDPWLWPFDAQSIWNLPLGSDAQYSPANLGWGKRTSIDREIIFEVAEDDPFTRLYAPGSWSHRAAGTKSPTGNPKDEVYVRFPTDKIVPDAKPGHTPNNTTAILQPDGETIVSVAPLARTQAGGPVYGWYYGEENIYGQGITGGHGGSNLSTIGGSLREGDLTDDDPIRHALKINIWGEKYLHYDASDSTPGYRWPALRADGYAANAYNGSNPQLEMGSLLAISPDVTPESLGISSTPALKLFYALQDYGAYVVDDTAWNVTAFNVQAEEEENFKETYGYEFSTNDKDSQWYQEYYKLVTNLQIVTNNDENAIGGGGEARRAPLAPAFENQASEVDDSSEDGDSALESNKVIGEVGTFKGIDHNLETIKLSNDYVNPVVFALPLSHNGRDSAIARITDIQKDSFSVYVQEAEYKDGVHLKENFSYVVLEAGNWQLADGTVLQVGTVNTDANAALGQWKGINFADNFAETPVVLSQVQTNNDSTFVRTRHKSSGNSGFQLALEPEEALKSIDHDSETVAWLAIEQGVGSADGLQFQAGISNNNVNHGWKTLNFDDSFESTPNFLANLASYNGSDPAGLRYDKINSDRVTLKVHEDRSLDSETNHINETVNFLAIEGIGELTATAYDYV